MLCCMKCVHGIPAYQIGNCCNVVHPNSLQIMIFLFYENSPIMASL